MSRIHFLFSIFLFISISILISCYHPDDYDEIQFNPEKNKDFIEVKAKSYNIPADGKSTVIITASIDGETDNSIRSVDFITTKGVFTNNNKVYTATFKRKDPTNGKRIVAEAELQSSVFVEAAVVTAKIKNIEVESDSIKFNRAYPENISVQQNSFAITQAYTSESIITANVTRTIGIPSAGQEVKFFVLNQKNDTIINTNKKFGNFRSLNNRSDEKGSTSVTFTLGDTTYLGKLKVFAITNVPNGNSSKVLIDSTNIHIIK